MRLRLRIVRKVIFNHVLIVVYFRNGRMYLNVAILHKNNRFPEKFISYVIFILCHIGWLNISWTVLPIFWICGTLNLLNLVIVARIYTNYCVFTTFVCDLIIKGLVDMVIFIFWLLAFNDILIRLSYPINLSDVLIFTWQLLAFEQILHHCR